MSCVELGSLESVVTTIWDNIFVIVVYWLGWVGLGCLTSHSVGWLWETVIMLLMYFRGVHTHHFEDLRQTIFAALGMATPTPRL